ncbi:Stp1/IreP family PP2C-type Ser/Thr phosphatase [Undibacterium oligocarboniphilum]|uniref:Stp1/IreP family PP2C-type Ser/Thr phosphatase n=1 Tax=Undibacterium oligocarboniphilum TaxID=666702 RepID=A0A850QHH0_9BURK|nr:Stp1/IreP family PP2C-type Ser/Thr phosphatase [Undibacterium oligocarboniphilum]MBC3870741.1 Stp1/IreP family PP2C-type Ser/Thr phosphatase [Undibacterium oligocarboniphilum]NVO78457.1 Stp1/IreP family PP2C-type Ser/Thr phosphatase [Undibacterium oligocarboniphilum]
MSYQYALEFAALSDPGRIRDQNEDAIIVCADYGCAVLADGMGGYKAGEVASAMSTRIIAEYLCAKLDSAWLSKLGLQFIPLSHWMNEAIQLANQKVFQTSQTNVDCFGMGTTVIVACCANERLLLAHVGDSRAYRYRGETLTRLTRDHSVLQEQINSGQITEEQARFSSIRNLITRAVGTQEEVEIDVATYPTEEGDVYMLCSDGLTDMLTHDEIQTVFIQHYYDLTACCKILVEKANDAGGIDNTSVVLFKIKKSPDQTWFKKILSR